MAAHDSSSSDALLPVGLTPEEKAHHIEHITPETALNSKKHSEYITAKQEITAWMGQSETQFKNIWETNKSKFAPQYPILSEVTEENFEAKKEHLERTVPEYIWRPLEEANHFAKRKKALETRPLPLLAKKEGGHSDTHDGYHYAHGSAPIPKYLDHDERYKTFVEGKVAEWNRQHPTKQITGDVLLTRGDESRYINPAVTALLPSLEAEAHAYFKENHSDDYNRYMENEKKRIYRDADGKAVAENDPAYQKLQKEINAKIQEKNQQNSEVEERTGTNSALTAESIDAEAMKQHVREEAYRTFIEELPEKARAYATTDDTLAALLVTVEKEQGAEENQQRQNASSQKEGEKILGVPESQLTSELIGPSSPEYAKIKPEVIEPKVVGQSPLGSSEPTSFAPGEGEGMASHMERATSRRGSALGSLGNNSRRLISGGQRLASLAAKATPLLSNPIFWIILGALILLFIIIVIIIAISGGGNDGTGQQEIPLSITKSAPTNVKNGEDIPYTITVSYPGTASDIIVTDPLPEGTTFVSATGKFTCEPSPCGDTTRTVTWYASAQSSSPTPATTQAPQPTTPPAATGTIHNLGLGASDGKRIDDLVKKIKSW